MSGKFWKWTHFVGIFVVIAIWIIAVPTGLIHSVAFVSHVSMAALVLAEVSSWQGSRTEMKQDQQIKQNEERDDTQDDVLGLDD